MALIRFLRRLDPDAWQIALASPAGDGLPALARSEGWPWHQLDCGPMAGGPRSAPRALASWPRARRLAREADVVYLNGSVCGRLLPVVHGARTVLHVHDLVGRVPPFWRMADVLLVPSEAVALRLPGLDAHVVGCPIEPHPPDVPAPWRPSDAPDGGAPVIGFVGRIEPRKGALDFVRAAPLIRARLPHARIVLVGGDPYGSDPDYLARVHIEGGGVQRYDWIEDAAGLMRHLHVLVLPSHEEPFGTVLAEAMMAGTPVVATRVGGLPEVVPDGIAGRLVPAGYPSEIARAVVEVLERREMLSTNARGSAQRFDSAAYARRVEALIANGLDTPCRVEGGE